MDLVRQKRINVREGRNIEAIEKRTLKGMSSFLGKLGEIGGESRGKGGDKISRPPSIGGGFRQPKPTRSQSLDGLASGEPLCSNHSWLAGEKREN